MNPVLVSIMAQVAAAQARVAGMQAENAHRISCGNPVAYGEEAFFIEAAMLDQLTIEARNA